jgi:glycine/D-amino acid oxidase-like deaminating enzyme
MRIAVVGAGPTGLVLAGSLARRGHRVDVIDRDPGPSSDGAWPRRGVMQFHHAHAVRPQVSAALQAELPEAYERWLELGAEPIVQTVPGVGEFTVGTRSRRETLERAVRTVIEVEPGGASSRRPRKGNRRPLRTSPRRCRGPRRAHGRPGPGCVRQVERGG